MPLNATLGVAMAHAPDDSATARRGLATAFTEPEIMVRNDSLFDDFTSKFSNVALVIVMVTASAFAGTMGLAALPVRVPLISRVALMVILPVAVVVPPSQS